MTASPWIWWTVKSPEIGNGHDSFELILNYHGAATIFSNRSAIVTQSLQPSFRCSCYFVDNRGCFFFYESVQIYTTVRFDTFCYAHDTVFYVYVCFHYGLATTVQSVASAIMTTDDSRRWTMTCPRLLALSVGFIEMSLRSLYVFLQTVTFSYIGRTFGAMSA